MATLDVHLVTPEREAWAGPAQMVVARGVDGMVGILPGHAPLLIRLAVAEIRIQREDGHWERAAVDGGFLHVTSGEEGTRVDVLAADVGMAGEIDRVAAEARVRELEERLRQKDDEGLRSELASASVRANLFT